MSGQEAVDLCTERGIDAMEKRGKLLIQQGKAAEGAELLEIAHHEMGVYLHLESDCSPLGAGGYHAN